MATARYWRAAVLGKFVTGPWLGEMAQTGISGVGADAGGFFAGAIRENLPTFDATAGGGVEDLGWATVEYGSTGPGAWKKAHQVAIARGLYDFVTALKNYQNTGFEWQEARLTAFDINDDAVNGASIFTFATPVTGGSPAQPLVTQSLVVSLRSGSRHPRGRGRMFVPVHPNDLSANGGLVPTVAQTAFANAAKDLLQDATPAVGQCQPAIISRTEHTYSQITELRVGDEWDQMQSRRRRRREIYGSLSV